MDRNVRLQKLRIRSWRRGTKEMDLLLGGFADVCLDDLEDREIDDLEVLLDEGDPLISDILFGVHPAGAHLRIVQRIQAHHGIMDAPQQETGEGA